jgi:hypothetical protein
MAYDHRFEAETAIKQLKLFSGDTFHL